jgi:3-hydroxyacyl-[acyl-carrier-protein] dehydratase
LSRLVSLVLTTLPELFLASPVNTDEIKACIPHRDPFLWLDEVTEISETHIVARKVLKESLPVFQGHYPAFPVFPGVLQCEACFQAGAVLISKLVPTGSMKCPW